MDRLLSFYSAMFSSVDPLIIHWLQRNVCTGNHLTDNQRGCVNSATCVDSGWHVACGTDTRKKISPRMQADTVSVGMARASVCTTIQVELRCDDMCSKE